MTNVRTLPVGEGNEEITLALDELAREGARRMIAAALRAEADEYVALPWGGLVLDEAHHLEDVGREEGRVPTHVPLGGQRAPHHRRGRRAAYGQTAILGQA